MENATGVPEMEASQARARLRRLLDAFWETHSDFSGPRTSQDLGPQSPCRIVKSLVDPRRS